MGTEGIACAENMRLLDWIQELLVNERRAVLEGMERRHASLLCELAASDAQTLPSSLSAHGDLTDEKPLDDFKVPLSPCPCQETEPEAVAESPCLCDANEPVSETCSCDSGSQGGPNAVSEQASRQRSKALTELHMQAKSEMEMSMSPADSEANWSAAALSRKNSRQSLGFLTDLPSEMSTSTSSTWSYRVRKLVTNQTFELTFCVLIVINTVIMAFEVQYYGFQRGYELNFPKYVLPAEETWPGAVFAFYLSELIFGTLFTLELCLKLFGMRTEFCRDMWNWFDTIVVFFWIVDTLLAGFLPLDPMLLRLARLARLLRLLRIVRKIQGFDSLFIMTTSLKGSIAVLVWAFVLLFLVQLMLAFFLNQLMTPFIEDSSNPEEIRCEVFKYFGTCSRAMLTMFELTLANWPPVARLLQEHVNEFWIIFSIAHKLTIGFAVLGVINGVFMQETFKVAQNDDVIMMRQKARERKQHMNKMQLLFDAADVSGDQMLQHKEFLDICDDPEIKVWLAAQEVDASDPDRLFRLLGRAKKEIDVDDLIKGVLRLKGAAKSIDLMQMADEQRRFQTLLIDMLKPLCAQRHSPAQLPALEVDKLQKLEKVTLCSSREKIGSRMLGI
eukprot:TRINITY_DN12270_c0_g1_i2.p1 TRINITY_DN12270_c0_g1~~TRINITY_DN12270_c0_g1_i2.p1  ORF type:complete len:615 (+),score=108.90 TRINITY_DN12270_c0_g1_i2:78-1922(+)